MADQELGELNFRRQLCLKCIQVISEMDDERKVDALKEYNRQLAEIDGKIEKLTGKPPATVIGLKTALLFPESKIGG